MSDRCSRGEAEDKSGPAIREVLSADQYLVTHTGIVPDEKKVISSTIKRWIDDLDCDIVLTTGGTGYAPRDVTPEATRSVIDREADNIATYLLIKGSKKTPFAALSRGIAGIRGRSAIVNLPGSPVGAKDGAEIVVPLLGHLLSVLRDSATDHPVEKK